MALWIFTIGLKDNGMKLSDVRLLHFYFTIISIYLYLQYEHYFQYEKVYEIYWLMLIRISHKFKTCVLKANISKFYWCVNVILKA